MFAATLFTKWTHTYNILRQKSSKTQFKFKEISRQYSEVRGGKRYMTVTQQNDRTYGQHKTCVKSKVKVSGDRPRWP